jgi:beta-glucosidase-like glycosyl hydrolase
MDIDCGGYLKGNLLNAINDGSVSNATVNQALYHLFRVQMRLGLFDPADKQPYMQIPTSAVNTTAHQQLALEDSRQGTILNPAGNPLADVVWL